MHITCIPHALLSPRPLQAHVLPPNQHTRPRPCPQLGLPARGTLSYPTPCYTYLT
jgi:hypothetical protein